MLENLCFTKSAFILIHKLALSVSAFKCYQMLEINLSVLFKQFGKDFIISCRTAILALFLESCIHYCYNLTEMCSLCGYINSLKNRYLKSMCLMPIFCGK